MKRFLLPALLVWALVPLLAQDRAAINGTITDSTGAAIPDAKVELTSPATGLHRQALTLSNGIYEFPSLPVGRYQITVGKVGFKPYVVADINLLYGQVRTVDMKMSLGTTSETVNVEATAEALNRDNAEVDGVIESPQIREIPLNGRNWATLMTLAPGAINTGDGSQRNIRFDGHSLDDSNFTLDGIDIS